MLERLVRRDGLPFDEAVTTLEVNYRCPATRDELHAIFVQLPERSLRRHVGEEELALVAVQAEASDASLERYEAEEIAGRVEAVLTAALADLAPRERLLLKLRFEDELKIVDIARLVNVPAKPLYRMLSNLVESLQEKLHQNGIDRSDIDRVVGNPTVTLGRALATVGELHDGSV